MPRLDLAAWARRETRRVAAKMPVGTASLPHRHQALFSIASTGALPAGMDPDVSRSALEALARLEHAVERLCLKFCATEYVTPLVPVLVLVQVLANIRNTYDADSTSWANFIEARLDGGALVYELLQLAEVMHRDLLAKMPRRTRPG